MKYPLNFFIRMALISLCGEFGLLSRAETETRLHQEVFEWVNDI